jgi:glycosyltransferase involved in cell wall biosynthesis
MGGDNAAATGPVVIVSAVSPYPRDAGKKVVLAGLVDYLVARLGPAQVHYVHIGRQRPDPDTFPAQLHHVEAPSSGEQVRSVLTRTLTGRHALQESALYAPRVERALRGLLRRIDAPLEIYDTVRMAQYAERIPRRPGQRRVVYLDDLFSVRYSRMLAAMRGDPTVDVAPLGEFHRLLPRGAARVVDVRPVQRGLLRIERRLVRRRELAATEHADSCLLVSPAEAETLARATRSAEVGVLPPLVDPEVGVRDYVQPPTFVLLGMLSLPHNHDATMTFLRECLPGLRRALPEARVVIVGGGASEELQRTAQAAGVELTGFVPDLSALLACACALVSPLRFGSGIKIKVLEALAHGVPVITTPVGAEGIPAGEHRGIVVEPDVARFAAHMARLADPDHNATVSQAAARHHRETYSRAAAFRHYDTLFGWA